MVPPYPFPILHLQIDVAVSGAWEVLMESRLTTCLLAPLETLNPHLLHRLCAALNDIGGELNFVRTVLQAIPAGGAGVVYYLRELSESISATCNLLLRISYRVRKYRRVPFSRELISSRASIGRHILGVHRLLLPTQNTIDELARQCALLYERSAGLSLILYNSSRII